jgi:hypothetical protein
MRSKICIKDMKKPGAFARAVISKAAGLEPLRRATLCRRMRRTKKLFKTFVILKGRLLNSEDQSVILQPSREMSRKEPSTTWTLQGSLDIRF